MMKIYAVKDYFKMSRQAANIIFAQVTFKPDSVLGLATGSTPRGVYEQLIQWYKEGDLDFHNVKSVNLDEYKGLPQSSKHSYHYYMNQFFFSHINIRPENTHLPFGMEEDHEKECARYDGLIESMNGIDLQLLGLGVNGHIGFNEPDTHFAKGTHCVSLTESTIQANSRLFENPDDVPRFAYSMGIQSIMQAKKILLVANGEEKADALRELVQGDIRPQAPATILQMHPDVTIVADEKALSKVDSCYYS